MSKKTVLIVEDEVILAKDLERQLVDLDYDVAGIATTGEKAIQMAKTVNPDLILMDIRLKGELDGIQTATQIQKHHPIPHVFLTAYSDKDTLNRAKETQPYGFLPKPIDIKILYSTLEMAFSRHGIEQELIIKEEKILSANKRLATILDNVQAGVILIDAKSKEILDVNPKASKIIGLPAEEITGKVCQGFICAQKKGHCPITDLSEKVENKECTLIRGDGSELSILKTAVTVHLDGQDVIVDSFVDIGKIKEAEDKIRHSEERLKILFDYAPDAYYIHDMKGNFIDGNKEAEKMIGYPREELIGMNFFKLNILPLDQIPKITKLLAKNVQGKPTGPNEIILRRRDGSLVPNEIISIPITLQGKKVVLGLARDVTKRKEDENAILKSEQKYRTLFNQVADPLFIFDKKTHFFLDCNEAVQRNYGYSKKELRKMTPLDLHPQAEHEVVKKQIDINTDRSFEYTHITKNGQKKVVEIQSEEIEYEGKPAWISIVRDVTEKKSTENALRESENFHRALAETTVAAIAMVDTNDQITYINTEFAAMLQYTKTELLDHKLSEIMESNDHAHIVQKRQQREKGAKDIYETRLKCKDGSIKHVLVSATPFYNANDVLDGTLAILVDITARKDLEEQLSRTQKLESVGRLAAGIAHEINTPTQYVGDNARFLQDSFSDLDRILSKVKALYEAQKNKERPDSLLEDLNQILEEVDIDFLQEEIPAALEQSIEGIGRVSKIVLAMKEFSHPGQTEKVNTDLNHAIETTVTVARNEWKYAAELKMDLEPTLPLVPCYSDEFNQVILNMITNAVHAIEEANKENSNERGLIEFRTRKVGQEVEVSIADTGCGIPEEAQSKIFDPFFTTKEVGKGTGQGLAISHDVIVKKLGGKLQFETQQGKGTTFIIQLPLEVTKKQKTVEMADQA